jgi:hypothetical protein
VFRVALVSIAVGMSVLPLGCGSGDETGYANGSGSASTPAANSALRAVGPSDPAENLKQLLAVSTPTLHDVSVHCSMSRRPERYPFSCRLDGATKSGSVRGKVMVIGIYPPTQTYAYELTYGPTDSPEG